MRVLTGLVLTTVFVAFVPGTAIACEWVKSAKSPMTEITLDQTSRPVASLATNDLDKSIVAEEETKEIKTPAQPAK
ncbi:hypothetical protein HPQ64_02140 [Rhizobiales bacterium]|uniref:hypothetical protein n=1 Tax=Hongsoonwoonella zoysiae TaxID=2821844 RepID=UPI0015605D7B|nr:hypothetical protein [Hongsoonwoonella zoysiae]NRG16482.1 hypothetical protein [Hongsoonwoonella zoysiae]